MQEKPHSCKKINSLPSLDDLNAVYSYSPRGFLFRKKDFLQKGVIEPASFLDTNKRKVLILNGVRFYEHRAIWKMHMGSDPVGEIDHINRIPTDNRIENLRDVDNSINYFNRRRFGSVNKFTDDCYIAYYKKQGKKVFVGCFATNEEARAALAEARKTLSVKARHEVRATPKPMEYWVSWMPYLMRPR